MRINELSLSGFRNYRRQSLTFDPDCNVIYGENAQGKTNLLEAVVYLSCGKSPRTHADRELIGFDAPGAVLEGRILSRDRDFVTRIELNRGKKRKMTVNGVAAKSAAALSDVLHTVFFAPEDLFLIRDGAAARISSTRRSAPPITRCWTKRRGSFRSAKSPIWAERCGAMSKATI